MDGAYVRARAYSSSSSSRHQTIPESASAKNPFVVVVGTFLSLLAGRLKLGFHFGNLGVHAFLGFLLRLGNFGLKVLFFPSSTITRLPFRCQAGGNSEPTLYVEHQKETTGVRQNRRFDFNQKQVCTAKEDAKQFKESHR